MHGNSDLRTLQKVVEALLGEGINVERAESIGGGSINRTLKLLTNDGYYFVKANSSENAVSMFCAEQDGLARLESSSEFNIPKVYGITSIENVSYILMDYIDSGSRKNDFWKVLGLRLARLHMNTSTGFGYHRNNYIGSLDQSNYKCDNWGDFFTNQRIEPMIKMARDQGLVSKRFIREFEIAMPQIINEMPVEPPALLHGDLWGGNLMVDAHGQPTIIDPAVYYGHREMDLAFTHMFGGFDKEFLEVYNEGFPLVAGFSQRINLYNLYPALVHLNIFGRSYLNQIETTISRFK